MSRSLIPHEGVAEELRLYVAEHQHELSFASRLLIERAANVVRDLQDHIEIEDMFC